MLLHGTVGSLDEIVLLVLGFLVVWGTVRWSGRHRDKPSPPPPPGDEEGPLPPPISD